MRLSVNTAVLAALIMGVMAVGSYGQEEAVVVPKKELVGPDVTPESGFDLTTEQRTRLQQLIPQAYAKLDRRQPVHVVALGDGVTRYISHGGEDYGDTHKSFAGVFTAELAKLFFYTGGLKDLQPYKEQPAKALESSGPEISIQNFGREGCISLHGIGRLTTDAFANKPSLILVAYGTGDARSSLPIAHYLQAHELAATLAKARDCDVIFVGPTTLLDTGASLREFARTRAYSSALEGLAARLGVCFYDAGQASATGRGARDTLDDAGLITRYNEERAEAVHTHDDGTVDVMHPNARTQARIGRGLYNALLNPAEPTYRIKGTAILDGAGGFSMEFKLKNLSTDDLKGRILLPEFSGLKPTATSIAFDTPAGKGQTHTASYAASDGGSIYRLDGSEAALRVPFLVVDEKRATPMTIISGLAPLAPVWTFGARDGLRSEAAAEFKIQTTAEAASGRYQVSWAGESSSGNFTAGNPTVFSLPLPSSAEKRIKAPLQLSVDYSGKKFQFQRGLEASVNTGLDQRLPLIPVDPAGKGGGVSASSPVTVRAVADPSGLTIIHEIATPLTSLADRPPFLVELQFDGRGFKNRRSFGFTDFLRLVPLADGSFKVSQLRPGGFGNGYAKLLDRTVIKPRRERLSSGGERISVTIPRSYFYLHEWALGNGNSLLGFNSLVIAQTPGATTENPYPGVFTLTDSGLNRHNAQSLGILELTARPTSRWSSRLY